MTECFAGDKWETKMETSLEKDDLVKLLQELQSRKGVLEKALSSWQERYSDVTDVEGDLGIAKFLTPVIQNLNEQKDNDLKTTLNIEKTLKTRPKRLESNSDDSESIDSEHSWIYDQYLTAEVTDENQNIDVGTDNQYFEVSSASSPTEKSDSSNETLQNLLERLRETRRKVSAKCDEFDGMVADISKEAEESVSLREKVGMTHRSLTLIEMKQEKVMREALYENVTANCTIRKLHEEVIQLRIREAHYQSDVQRLMAENSRLKMKLMEARFHGSTGKTKVKKSASTSVLPKILPEEKTEATLPSPPPIGSGLLDIDDLHEPVCAGAIHRGSLCLYRSKNEEGTITVSDDNLISTASTVRRRKTPCPLCSNLPECDDDLEPLEEDRTRSIGTSTADFDNIVANRKSIVFMGMVLPIPLFLSCLLRTIEESMLMIGRVCFAELPPSDVSFPELHQDVMEALKEMLVKVKQKIS